MATEASDACFNQGLGFVVANGPKDETECVPPVETHSYCKFGRRREYHIPAGRGVKQNPALATFEAALGTRTPYRSIGIIVLAKNAAQNLGAQ
jgi:hypothetical protein